MWGAKRIPLTRLVVTDDVHTHLLPGVDDGGFTPHTAAATLARMHARGVRRVWLTPHVMAGMWDNTAAGLRDAMERFRLSLPATGIPELHLGAEYMIDEGLAAQLQLPHPDLLTIGRDRVLVEMSYWGASPQLFDVVAAIRDRGLTPVMAHPERYGYLSPGDFDRLHEAGCEFQLDLGAAAGVRHGGSTAIMNRLLDLGLYRHTGSDIHSPRQYEALLAGSMDTKTAEAGEVAALWHIA